MSFLFQRVVRIYFLITISIKTQIPPCSPSPKSLLVLSQARSVGLTEGAIRRRVKKMVDGSLIRKFTIETTSEIEGITLVKTDPTQTRNTALKMKKISDKVCEVSAGITV